MTRISHHPDEHFDFDQPEPPYAGRNHRRAFERGFGAYVWASTEDRTDEIRDRRARGRYHHTSMQEAFCMGWNEAARQHHNHPAAEKV